MTKDVILGSLLLFFAAMLDGLQVLIGLGFSMGFTALSSVTAWIPVAGQLISGGVTAVGMVFGATVDICLSASFGSMIIGLLIFSKMFYPATVFGGATFEMLPFLDIFPGWTVMVARCIWKKYMGTKGILATATSVAVGVAAAERGAGALGAGSANTPNQANSTQAGISNGAKISVQSQLNKDVRPKTKYAK